MTRITLPSGEWLLMQVPPHTGNVIVRATVHCGYGSVSCYDKFTNKETTLLIPPGTYQLHGSDQLNLTEDESSQVVEYDFYPLTNDIMGYKNYLDNDKHFANPLESYASLLTANGHKVGETIPLKKIK